MIEKKLIKKGTPEARLRGQDHDIGLWGILCEVGVKPRRANLGFFYKTVRGKHNLYKSLK